MPLRFKIESLDQVCNPGGTIIDEPVGWDAIYMTLKRDKTWRGFFDFFDDSLGSLQFDFKNQPLPGGGQILKELYDTYGIDAEATLVIEFQCADLDTWDELYRGRFVFSKYKFTCGDMCYVEIGLENVSCLMRFANRYDQKVDLDSLATFDAGEGCESYTNLEVPVTNLLIANDNPNNSISFESGILPTIENGSKLCITGTQFNDGTYTIISLLEVTLLPFPIYIAYVQETVTNESIPSGASLQFNVCIPFTATLPSYDGLGKEITLPEKPLRAMIDWSMDMPYTQQYIDDACPPFVFNEQRYYGISFDWNKQLLSEIEDNNPSKNEFFGNSFNGNIPGSKYEIDEYDGIISYNATAGLSCITNLRVQIKLQGTLTFQSDNGLESGAMSIRLAYGNTNDGFNFIVLQNLGALTGQNSVTKNVSINYDNVINLKNGDRLYLQLSIIALRYSLGVPTFCPTDPFTLDINFTEGSLKITADSFCAPTTAKVYMVNEALSRIAEATTNDCLRVYSQYFGRTDSQPYSVEQTGCGGFEAITNGLKIRNALQADGTDPTMPISMKDLFEGLSAIHNLGLGVEADTNPGREGKQLIRVEPLKYFFNTNVVMVFDGVREIKREVDTSIIYSVYKTGYSKWETENTNGLYDLHGSREYRTKTSQVRNELNKLSNLIASDYAIEVTRRQFGKTTTDWKYDNDNFIVCVQNKICGTVDFVEPDRIEFSGFAGLLLLNYFNIGDEIIISGTVSNNGTFEVIDKGLNYLQLDGAVTNEADVFTCFENVTTSVYSVEQGNITQDANILFPEYQYNYRITPARNAIRHLHTLGNQVVNCWDEEIRFTNGTGNITAKGKLEVPDVCVLEGEQLAENEDIDIWKFDLPESQFPIHRPELVKFEYPLSYQDYKLLAGTDINGVPNYYKLVGYDCNGVVEYGWIEELKYQPFQGMCEFTIRPKKECNNIGPILDEDLNPILTEDDEFIYPDNQTGLE